MSSDVAVDGYVYTQYWYEQGWSVEQDGVAIPDKEWDRNTFFKGLTLGRPYHDMEAMPTVEEMVHRTRESMQGRRELDRHVVRHMTQDWACLPRWFRVTLNQVASVLVTGTILRSPEGVLHVPVFYSDIWFKVILCPFSKPPDGGHNVRALTPRLWGHALGVREI